MNITELKGGDFFSYQENYYIVPKNPIKKDHFLALRVDGHWVNFPLSCNIKFETSITNIQKTNPAWKTFRDLWNGTWYTDIAGTLYIKLNDSCHFCLTSTFDEDNFSQWSANPTGRAHAQSSYTLEIAEIDKIKETDI